MYQNDKEAGIHRILPEDFEELKELANEVACFRKENADLREELDRL